MVTVPRAVQAASGRTHRLTRSPHARSHRHRPVAQEQPQRGNGDCVEVARYADAGRAVRDSKNASGPIVAFTHTEWSAFIEWTKTDRPA
ncbi:DUF397 domain-containing protein [Streptomyces sp. NPDC049881]|uniref:DUF397 domain-containing protein n=1 Tax=Streptomyces sp. NPDC049881 TaxID=3155778 RepID=UPI0034429043